MNFKPLLFCAFLASHLSSTTAATVIKILHINPQAKVRAIWGETAQAFESAHPGVKVEFDYLENEAFKANYQLFSSPKARQYLPGSFRHLSRRQGGFLPDGHLGFDGRLLKEIAQGFEKSEWLEIPID